jgi:hypothetical protein
LAGNTFQRREKKIIIDAALMEPLRQRIEEYMYADPYNKDGEPYMICNLYFDNEHNDVIRNSVQLPKYKEKLRLRSYDTPDLDTKVFLEIKRKQNGIGTKRRAKITLQEVYDFLERREYPKDTKYINTQVLREIEYYLSHTPVEPVAYVSYLRYAYHGKEDPDFRVTFDFDILSRRHDLTLESGRYGEALLPDGKMIVEVKFAGAVPYWFVQIMNEYGLAFHTFSKIGTDLKKNVLKNNGIEEFLLTGFI